MTPDAVELSVCTGDGGCGHPISMRACLSGNISLAVTKRAPSSASAADERTNLNIFAMLRMGPL